MEVWEFGRTLRRWRDRVPPEAVGLPLGGRRRTAGLRREELASLTGISTDYLTRLEQGRSRSPSAQVVEALARGLRLSDPERDLLHELAGLAPPGPELVPTRITVSVQRLLDRLADTPVAVFDATWTLLVANAPYDALMGDTSGWTGFERNSIWRNLLTRPARVVDTTVGHDDLLAGLVADLRRTASRYPADHSVGRLVDDLRARSPRFVALWESEDLPTDRVHSKRKTIDHPAVGLVTIDCDTLYVATDDVRVMVYTAEPGSEDAERLELAIVLGTQQLV